MSSSNRPARLNRTLLAVLGLVLVAAGGAVLAVAAGVLRPPWPGLVPSTRPVLTWVPWAGAGGAAVLGLLCLRWLVAQAARRPRTGTWELAADPAHGSTRLAADTATAPLVAELTGYPGVRSAGAWLTGGPGDPALTLVVTVDPDVSLAVVRERIGADALPRFRQALELAELPVTVRFQLARTAQRAR